MNALAERLNDLAAAAGAAARCLYPLSGYNSLALGPGLGGEMAGDLVSTLHSVSYHARQLARSLESNGGRGDWSEPVRFLADGAARARTGTELLADNAAALVENPRWQEWAPDRAEPVPSNYCTEVARCFSDAARASAELPAMVRAIAARTGVAL